MRNHEPPHRRAGRPKNPVSRETLLDTAQSAFAANGFAGTSMNDIAGKVGLRKSSLFHHFPTKEGLYVEVLSRITEDLGLLVIEAGQPDGDFLERLDRLGELVVRYLGSHPDVARLLMREMVDSGMFFTGPGKQAVEATLVAVAQFLESGMEAEIIPWQEPRHLAMSITGLHLTFYAAAEFSSELVGDDVFGSNQIGARVSAVLAQIRRLCGAPPP